MVMENYNSQMEIFMKDILLKVSMKEKVNIYLKKVEV